MNWRFTAIQFSLNNTEASFHAEDYEGRSQKLKDECRITFLCVVFQPFMSFEVLLCYSDVN